MVAIRKLGTRLAPPFGVLGVCAVLAMFAMGCLVTNSKDFSVEPNVPPTIASAPGAMYSLGDLHVLDLSASGGTTPNIQLDVVVTDLNVQQSLQYVVYIDGTIQGGGMIQPTADGSPDRDLMATPDVAPLMQSGCHRVEMDVSGRFQFANSTSVKLVPVEAGDIGTAVWWFFTKTDPTQVIDPASCPSSP